VGPLGGESGIEGGRAAETRRPPGKDKHRDVDLRNVLLVDREAVKLVALSEANGTELRNCRPSEQGLEGSEDIEGA